MNKLRLHTPFIVSSLVLAAVALALSTALWAGIAQTVDKPTEEDLTDLGFIYIGENFADKLDDVIGMETRIRVFQRGYEKIGLYHLPNLEIYAFARMTDREPIQAFVDADNDGYCEDTIGEGEDFVIDYKAYKLSKNLYHP